MQNDLGVLEAKNLLGAGTELLDGSLLAGRQESLEQALPLETGIRGCLESLTARLDSLSAEQRRLEPSLKPEKPDREGEACQKKP